MTSLGLVQLTRKRLGTGLIEAFSTTCSHCSGRGIVLHADPVDTVAAAARKSESGSRRGKRGKRGRSEEAVVARVPVHAAGEHPMFKAMAAANGKIGEDDESEEELADEFVRAEIAEDEADTADQVARETVEEDLDDLDEETDDEDSDDEDSEEIDLDEVDEDAIDDDDLDGGGCFGVRTGARPGRVPRRHRRAALPAHR